jgi:hypothetical protein
VAWVHVSVVRSADHPHDIGMVLSAVVPTWTSMYDSIPCPIGALNVSTTGDASFTLVALLAGDTAVMVVALVPEPVESLQAASSPMAPHATSVVNGLALNIVVSFRECGPDPRASCK